MKAIAIFPIPNCVTFPGMIFPLHVFEPRYRKMIKQCIEENREVAICHTKKEIHSAKPAQSREETLASNQATYQPQDVFSAGPCTLIETSQDGRLQVDVELTQRYRKINVQQTLPYNIFECEPLMDQALDSTNYEKSKILQDKILHRLSALASAHNPKMAKLLLSPEWLEKPLIEFSFEIFSIIQINAPFSQALLEETSTLTRLEQTLTLLQ